MVNTKLPWTACVATVFAVALSQQAGAQFRPQRTTYLTSERGTRVSTLEPAREDDAIARQEAA